MSSISSMFSFGKKSPRNSKAGSGKFVVASELNQGFDEKPESPGTKSPPKSSSKSSKAAAEAAAAEAAAKAAKAQEEAALKMQSVSRGWFGRRDSVKLKEDKEKQTAAAVKVQAMTRGNTARKMTAEQKDAKAKEVPNGEEESVFSAYAKKAANSVEIAAAKAQKWFMSAPCLSVRAK